MKTTCDFTTKQHNGPQDVIFIIIIADSRSTETIAGIPVTYQKFGGVKMFLRKRRYYEL